MAVERKLVLDDAATLAMSVIAGLLALDHLTHGRVAAWLRLRLGGSVAQEAEQVIREEARS